MSNPRARIRFPRLLVAGVAALTLLLIGGADLAAQTGAVTGVVRDATTAQPVVGAQVSIVGTALGAPTNNTGRFLIQNVPAGEHTVRVQYIGYGTETQRVRVQADGTATLTVELRSEVISLEGVIATGTAGRARRREVGNSISQINATDIQVAAIADVGDVLQGRASGVQISDNSGQVGAGSTIRLRGNNSINMGNDPLIYIDGVRVESNPTGSDGEVGQSPIALDLVNPNDIERIEIIKGPAATTLYGTEAAGGVIQVFTKRGAAGAPQFNMSIDQGFHNMPHVGPDKDVNPTGLNLNDCSHEPGCPASGSWFRNAHMQRYNLSVRGGGEEVTYFASGRWGRQEGVVAPQGMDEYTVRANVAFRPTPGLELQFNNMYARRDIVWIPDGNNADGFILNVLRGERGYTPGNDDSRVLEMDLLQEINHYITGLQVTWNPIPSVTQRLNLGLDYETSDLQDFKKWGYFASPEGDREDDLQQDRNLTFDYSGTWATSFMPSLGSSFSWGAQLYDEYSYSLNGFDQRFAGPGDQLLGDGTLRDVAEGRTRIRSGGFFVQEMVGIADRLFLTGGVRWDGFSTFGEGFGLAAYPKVSAAYTVSDESFFPDALGQMKLRAAWGKSGKAPAVFAAARIYEATSADEAQPAVIIANLGNPDLGPETASELELGVDGSLFDSRIQYELTWYDQTTSDALIGVQEPPSHGTEEATLRNIGEVANQGIEASLNVGVLRRDNLDLQVGAHYTRNTNEVISLGGLPDLGSSIQVGYPLFMYWNDRVQNADAVGERPVYEKVFIGPRYPTDTYSLSSRLTLFRRLSFDVLGEAQTGHYLENGTGYQNMRRRVWPTCNALQAQISEDASVVTAGDRARCDPNRSDYGMWTEPADFFKLRSATMSYRLPETLIPGVRSATVRLQARNLFTITDYSGLDPEAEDGGAGGNFRNEYYNLPPARTFILNLTVNF